jgi:2-oxo-4-hydroxy-4-carboxy-5-ureidoimidazoline decarboxylase
LQAQQTLDGPSARDRSRQWSATEQSQALGGEAAVKAALARGNQEYEERFGCTFIVCATGKSAAQILQILLRRLENDPRTELYEAAREQQQITHIRLQRWLRE